MSGHSVRRSRQRGFSLLEIMAAVMIVGILSAAALPSMIRRMKDQRAQTLAQMYGTFIREGRTRAMGRGTAHLVRFSRTAQARGSVQLFEAVEPINGAANCANLPRIGTDSCNAVTWVASPTGTGNARLVDTLNQPDSLYSEVYAKFMLSTGNEASGDVDICFTPAGRSYFRQGGSNFGAFPGVPYIEVRRPSGGDLLERDVLVLQNGSTQVETVIRSSL